MLLPRTVDRLLREGSITVKVLHTADKWYGVTYAADRPLVASALQALTDRGLYPDNLWG